jgi:hypothetical protein
MDFRNCPYNSEVGECEFDSQDESFELLPGCQIAKLTDDVMTNIILPEEHQFGARNITMVDVPRDPGCWVFLPTCPKQTDFTWNLAHWHYDSFENAEYYRERCLQRKFEWDDWCGITTSRTEFVGYAADVDCVRILSVDHSDGTVGYYFNYNIADVNAILNLMNDEVYSVTQYRNNEEIWSGAVKLWTDVNGASVGDGHGRRDEGCDNDQWQVDDQICFDTDFARGTCMPSGQYELAECCPAGYTQIDSEADCQSALEYLGSGNEFWGGTGDWSSRPTGCFRHTANDAFHYNPTNVIGSSVVGDDEIICKHVVTSTSLLESNITFTSSTFNASNSTMAPSVAPTTKDDGKVLIECKVGNIVPTASPTVNPTAEPTANPTFNPTSNPSEIPSQNPSVQPSFAPSLAPTFTEPSVSPTATPTTSNPTVEPTAAPSFTAPTNVPSSTPTTSIPSSNPTTSNPTISPTNPPSAVEVVEVAESKDGGNFLILLFVGVGCTICCIGCVYFKPFFVTKADFEENGKRTPGQMELGKPVSPLVDINDALDEMWTKPSVEIKIAE